MKITFRVKRETVYEFSVSGDNLAEIASRMRSLRAEEASGESCGLRDLMYDGDVVLDSIGIPKPVKRED